MQCYCHIGRQFNAQFWRAWPHTHAPLSLLSLTLSARHLSHSSSCRRRQARCLLETKPKNDKACTKTQARRTGKYVKYNITIHIHTRHRLNCGSFNIRRERKRWHLKPEISQFAPWETMQLSLAARCVPSSLARWLSLFLSPFHHGCMFCEMRGKQWEHERERLVLQLQGHVKQIFLCPLNPSRWRVGASISLIISVQSLLKPFWFPPTSMEEINQAQEMIP